MGCFFCFNCLYDVPFISPRQPYRILHAPSKVFLSLTPVSQPPHRAGFSLCLCSSAKFVCCLSLCKCVSAPLPFVHTAIFSFPVIHSTPTQATVLPLRRPLSFLKRNGQSSSHPHLTSFREDSTLDMPVTHLCRHWFIPPVRLRCDVIHSMERDR